MSLIAPLILLALMYVLLVRPQQQRVRRQRQLLASLVVGDRVVTLGGIMGQIVGLDDESAEVQVADGVVVAFVRGAISRKLEADGGGPPAGAGDEHLDLAGVDEARSEEPGAEA